jgi:hypothetical protein
VHRGFQMSREGDRRPRKRTPSVTCFWRPSRRLETQRRMVARDEPSIARLQLAQEIRLIQELIQDVVHIPAASSCTS